MSSVIWHPSCLGHNYFTAFAVEILKTGPETQKKKHPRTLCKLSLWCREMVTLSALVLCECDPPVYIGSMIWSFDVLFVVSPSTLLKKIDLSVVRDVMMLMGGHCSQRWKCIMNALWIMVNCKTVTSHVCGCEFMTLQWRHNALDGVSNHQLHGCLLSRVFRLRSKKTSKLRVTGPCVGNSPGPVNSPHKGPVTWKMFPFDDVIMNANDAVKRWSFVRRDL